MAHSRRRKTHPGISILSFIILLGLILLILDFIKTYWIIILVVAFFVIGISIVVFFYKNTTLKNIRKKSLKLSCSCGKSFEVKTADDRSEYSFICPHCGNVCDQSTFINNISFKRKAVNK